MNGYFRLVANYASGFIACLLSSAILLFLTTIWYSSFQNKDWIRFSWMTALCLFVLPLEFRFFWMTLIRMIRSTSDSESVLLQVAMDVPRESGMRRYFTAIWWGLHLPCSLLIAASSTLQGPKQLDFVVIASLMASVFCANAFGFLLLAQTCFYVTDQQLRSLADWWWVWGLACGIALVVAQLIFA